MTLLRRWCDVVPTLRIIDEWSATVVCYPRVIRLTLIVLNEHEWTCCPCWIWRRGDWKLQEWTRNFDEVMDLISWDINFVTACLSSCIPNPFWNGSTLKGKNLFPREINFVTFFLSSCIPNPFWKGSTLKRKEFAPRESNSFLLE